MAKNTDIHAGIDTKKRTTKVNLVVVLGVLLFIALGFGYVINISRNPPTTEQDNKPLSP